MSFNPLPSAALLYFVLPSNTTMIMIGMMEGIPSLVKCACVSRLGKGIMDQMQKHGIREDRAGVLKQVR